jgi:hypothetical protein
MPRPLFYIAGPYSAPTYHERSLHILRAQECAIWCADNHLFYFCPHMHSAHMDLITPQVPKSYWLDLDVRILEQCQALILLQGWERSPGTAREMEHGNTLGLPSYRFPDDKEAIVAHDQQ